MPFLLEWFTVFFMSIALVKQIADSVRNSFIERGDFSKNLAGACALASVELFMRLRKLQMPVLICANHGHCWVEVTIGENVFAVDVTATQFGFRDGVLVAQSDKILEKIGRDLSRDRYAGSWERMKVFKRVCDLRRWQTKHGWPEDQIV